MIQLQYFVDFTSGVPSTTKFKFSNFVVENAIVIFEHAIVIFKHAIVQLKYEIRNGMLILLFNMKPLTLLPTAFYDFLGYGDFYPTPQKTMLKLLD